LIELADLPQPSQHPDLRAWAERLIVTLRQAYEQLQNGIPADLTSLVEEAQAAIDALAAEDVALDARLDALESAPGFSLPIGMVVPIAGPTVPALWLPCNGQEISRATYALLDAAIWTHYGAYTDGSGGVGTTHMRVPDLRGRTIFGQDAQVGGVWADRVTNTGTGNPGVNTQFLGAWGGVDRHTLTTAQLAVHAHSVVRGTAGAGSTNGFVANINNAGNVNTGNAGSGNAHPILPPMQVLQYIIHAGV
jgi:microcystin-dependent protein